MSVHCGHVLEHSRIFYFYNNGEDEIYMGSADWMPRNLDKRVEILFPVEKEELKGRVKDMLSIQLADTVKASVMQPDGTYSKIDRRGKALVNSQEYFCEKAAEIAKQNTKLVPDRVFIPLEHEDEESDNQ